jgi:hypothetical protein
VADAAGKSRAGNLLTARFLLKQKVFSFGGDIRAMAICLKKSPSYTGLFIALLVIGSWVTSTVLLMQWQVNFSNPLLYLFVLVQMHLYTGLFITAHDAMHGTIAPNKNINNLIGFICTFLVCIVLVSKALCKAPSAS